MDKGQILEFKGKINGILASNGSEHKDIPGRLNPAEKGFQDFFERMPIAFWELDLSGVQKLLGDLGQAGMSRFRSAIRAWAWMRPPSRDFLNPFDLNELSLKIKEILRT